jgi:AcrR family transcriptional regulator
MPEKTNRRDQMVDSACRLFMEHGYNTTSVRQIAEDVGCTEAALYYHFKSGKRELLQAVLEVNIPNIMDVLEQLQDVESLYELIHRFGQHMSTLGQTRVKYLRWITSEFSRLSDDEREIIHEKYLAFHCQLAVLVGRFVSDPQAAETVAWMLMSTGFGYAQLFLNLNLRARTDFSGERLFELMAHALACTVRDTPCE